MAHDTTPTDLRELECFLALCEELHFGRAAERLGVSQTRVSQLLRALEARIGGKLLERTSRRVRLTALGARFEAELRPAVDAVTDAVRGAQARASGVGGTLRIGFVGSVNSWVLDVVEEFRAGHPQAEVRLVELPYGNRLGPVRAAEVDAAFMETAGLDDPRLRVGPVVLRSGQVVVLAPAHPLAARAAVGSAELAGMAMVTAPPVSASAHEDGTATVQEALSVVAAGRAGLLLPDSCQAYWSRSDLTAVRVVDAPPAELALVRLRRHAPPGLREFVALLERRLALDPAQAPQVADPIK
ncbi:LysR family transcriptional regulator [Streptomyces boninensis]|uniref:LysR family transcriptional regulator n=1 Tax=Streptomyces boninensis TaxID=2039455 RepID=UPI003B21EF0C